MARMRRINAANALTVGRLVLAPLFVVAYALTDIWPGVIGIRVALSTLWVLFVIMELTDVLDGMVARRQGIVSDLGKILDPFADVVCRLTYFITLTVAGIMPLWFVIIVFYREFAAIFLRLLLYRDGYALGAASAGKLKSWFYSLSATAGLFILTVERLPSVSRSILDSMNVIRGVAYGVYAVAAMLALWSIWGYLRFYQRRKTQGPGS
ncbi:MAG: CDP-diacylglycerol--glycerol-3-phosphate 3-phosphatidyltransferase [Spirochaetales bacterium]|nr:CDP-diacylglycerol--glycerol-3-phosphate 3-phosphatidyltransferase [Spirochaetales bacterium]